MQKRRASRNRVAGEANRRLTLLEGRPPAAQADLIPVVPDFPSEQDLWDLAAEVLGMREVQRRFRLPRATVYRWAAMGRIRVLGLQGRRYYLEPEIRREAFLDWYEG